MRYAAALTLFLAGCAGAPPPARPVLAPSAAQSCDPQTLLGEGLEARTYPPGCNPQGYAADRYALGLRIAQLEEELRDVNYLVASRDRASLGSKGFLIGRRVEIKNELRALRRLADRPA